MNFGFDIANTPTETPTQNLTAGTYNLLIDSIEFGGKDASGKYKVVTLPEEAGTDLVIQIKCVLADAANGFGAGWKHNLFFRPLKDGVAGDIARSHFKQIVIACGLDPVTADNNALIGRMFRVTLEQQKNNPEYTNIKKIESVSDEPTVEASATEAPATKTNDSEPNWN